MVTLVQSLDNELQVLAFTLFCILLSGDIQINLFSIVIINFTKIIYCLCPAFFHHIGKLLTYLEPECICAGLHNSKIIVEKNLSKQNKPYGFVYK